MTKAPDRPDPATAFKYEEFDEYLLIEDAGTSRPGGIAGPQQSEEPRFKEPVKREAREVLREGSPDSGYDGKHSRTSSPEEGKQPQEVEPEGDIEEWCIVEHKKKHRPQGLYGYRYVEYDDEEAEGNIHITDEDL